MAFYYLETSALVKLYVLEPGSDRLLKLAGTAENQFVILALSPVEVRSAIRRRERAGDIDAKMVNFVLDRLQRHIESRFLIQVLSDAVLDGALEIVDRYALRAYDAIQLAGCLAIKTAADNERPVFVCCDQQLLAAARSEMIAILDPCAPY